MVNVEIVDYIEENTDHMGSKFVTFSQAVSTVSSGSQNILKYEFIIPQELTDAKLINIEIHNQRIYYTFLADEDVASEIDIREKQD